MMQWNSIQKHCYLLHWIYRQKRGKYVINSVNPLYLIISKADGFTEEKEGSKYLDFAFTYNNSEVLKSMQKFGVESKIKLKQ